MCLDPQSVVVYRIAEVRMYRPSWCCRVGAGGAEHMVRREERRSAVLRQRPGAAWPARSVQRAPLLLLSAPRARSEPFPALVCHRLPRAGTSVVGLPVTASVLSFHFPHCVWRRGLKGPVFSPEGPSRRVRGWGGGRGRAS